MSVMGFEGGGGVERYLTSVKVDGRSTMMAPPKRGVLEKEGILVDEWVSLANAPNALVLFSFQGSQPSSLFRNLVSRKVRLELDGIQSQNCKDSLS